MAEDPKRQAEEILKILRDQTAEYREQDSIQAENYLTFRNITDEITESISKIRKRTEAEKVLLGLSRKLQEAARENNKHLLETGKLESSMEKVKKQQLQTAIELEAQSKLLRGRELTSATDIYKALKQVEALEIEGLKTRESLADLSKEERKEAIKSLKKQEIEKENLSEKLSLMQRYLGATKQEIDLIRKKERQLIDQEKKIQQIKNQRREEKDRGKKSILGYQLEQESKILKKLKAEYAQTLSQQPLVGPESEKQIKYLITLMRIQDGFQNVYETRQETLLIEERVRKTMGLTGVGVKALAGVMKAIGINSSVVAASLSDAEKAMRKAAESSSKWQTFMTGITTLSEGVGKHLRDPLVILTGMLKVLDKLNQNVTLFQRTIGISREGARELNFELENQARNANHVFINSDRLRKSFVSMTEQLGFSAAVLGGETLTTFTHLTENLGMSVQHATSLTTLMRLNGKSTESQMKSMDRTVQAFAKQNKFGVDLKKVYSDIGSFSKAVLLNIGKSPREAALLATTLQKVKLEMGDLESIMSNLVQFESSIQNEIEARLLTGDRINLSRARELALMNDYRGVANEIAQQEAVRRAFIDKNRIAQESVAKAIGVSVEKLGEMYYQQELIRLGAPGFKNVYGDLTYESTKALSTSQQFKEMVDKLKLSFQAMLLPLEPLVNILGKVIQGFSVVATHPIGKWLVGAAAGWLIFGKVIKGTFTWITNILPKLGMKGLGGILTKGTKKTLEDLGEGLGKMAKEDTKKGAENLKTASGGFSMMILGGRGIKLLEKIDGRGLKDALSGMAKGLEKMSGDEVESGSKNLLRSSFSFVAMIPGYLGVKLLEKINGPLFNKSLTGIARGLQKMALPGVKSGIGSLALFSLAGALGVLSLPFLLGISLMGVKAGIGLSGLATGLAALGNPATLGYVAAGTAILLGLGGAVWMVGKGLGAAAPLVESFGNIIKKTFSGLSEVIRTAAEGFSSVIGSIQTIKIKDISNVLSLAKALNTLTDSVKGLKQAGPLQLNLQTTVSGKEKEQEGIFKTSSPTVKTSQTLGTPSPEVKALLQKIDELISILKTKGNVYLDGNKVGETLRMGTYRQGL